MKIIKPSIITPAMITSCNVPEDDYSAWLIGTAYVVGNKVLSNHKIYECLVNNTGYLPDDNISGTTPKWLFISYDNRWLMFDEVVGSRTEIAKSLTLIISPGMTDTITFLDLDATEIIIMETAPVDGLVYSKTINLVSTSGIIDAYTYHFKPIVTTDSISLLDIPPYSNASISITINNPSGIVKVGTIAFGLQTDLGWTQYDPTIGITDFSRKEVDIFGNYSILERAFSKRLSCQVFLDNSAVDSIVRMLAQYRATPVIWVAVDSGFSTMIIYGFYRSFAVTVKYIAHSTCTFELEGLT